MHPPAGSGIPSSIVYPPSWIAQPLSPNTSDGLYFSDSSEEEAGTGISVTVINSPLSSLLVDPGNVLLSQTSSTVNGESWTFILEQEPGSGLMFYHAFLQLANGVLVIGGNDSPANEAIVSEMVSQFTPQ
jgi:carbohydrate-selective porin OprB